MDEASALPAASCARNPAAPRTSSSCSRSEDRSQTDAPPHARSDPQSAPHVAPSNRDPRPSSPALCSTQRDICCRIFTPAQPDYPAASVRDNCSGAYNLPRPVSASDLEVMRRLDRLHLEFPFAGSRMLRGLLAAEGCKIGRRHVTTLMARMGIEALYRRPRTTKPEPGHKIYPYLLRAMAITRPNQVWAMDITYIPMARGFVYLAVVLDWFSRRVLSWRLSITMEAAFCVDTLEDALARHGTP